MNTARTLGIFMALAALSFVLGFFVLSRLMPGSGRPAMAAALPSDLPPASDRHATSANPEATDLPVRGRGITASEATTGRSPAAAPKAGSLGPSLDPVMEAPAAPDKALVQKPRKIEDLPSRPTHPPATCRQVPLLK